MNNQRQQEASLYDLDGDSFRLTNPEKRNLHEYTKSESQVYYWAVANGIEQFNDYSKLSQAIAEGFDSVSDRSDSLSKGFSSSSSYYSAKKSGFNSSKDYELAQRLSIQTFTDFDKVKKIFDGIDYLINKDKKSYQDATYSYLLSTVSNNKPISVSSLVEFASKTIGQNRNVLSYFNNRNIYFDDISLKKYLDKNPVSDYGRWDSAGGVFYPK